MQHLFTEAFERGVLNRTLEELTTVAGYAGGTSSTRPLCYPNPNGYNDHENFGFAEAVELDIEDETVLEQAALVFFKDFMQVQMDPPIWTRKDVYDQGAQYRALVGIPGGLEGKYGSAVRRANVNNMELKAGNGSEQDTFLQNRVYVYDSDSFGFAPAEACLQYHDDRNEAPFGQAYNDIRGARLDAGTLSENGCPANFIRDTCSSSTVSVLLRHVELGKWKESSATVEQDAALDCLHNLSKALPEIVIEYSVGPDITESSGDERADFGLVASFNSSTDLGAYEASDPYQACLSLLRPILVSRRSVDFWETTQL